MAKFLTTVGNSFYIEQIILNAEKNLTLVTPYLNLSNNLIDRLNDADKRNVKITLIYGKSELHPTEKKKILAFNNIEIYFCKNLHAKCYLNEHSLIITSMNLYEFSERNNREMGILIDKETDDEIFKDTLKEIESIKNSSELKTIKTETVNTKLISLPDKKYGIYDFHIPSLYKILKLKFKDYTVLYEEQIIIKDFPIKEVHLEINGRIDFHFKNDRFYDWLRNNYREKIKGSCSDERFFWNYCLNIYTSKRFEVSADQEGLEKKVSKYLEIIDNVKEQITIASKNYN